MPGPCKDSGVLSHCFWSVFNKDVAFLRLQSALSVLVNNSAPASWPCVPAHPTQDGSTSSSTDTSRSCPCAIPTAAVEFGPGAVPGIASQILGFWCAVPGQAKVRADCPGVSGHTGLVDCLDLSSSCVLGSSCCSGGCCKLISQTSRCLLPTDFIGMTWLSGS